jgi:TetR/AcrR family transcriptional regulator, transcriptional repressor of bet genes
MPKLGMEPIRRRALIDAAIAEIGAKGGLDVTVGQIAKRAGVSAALAHHYFGNKQQILIETMRHLLREFNAVAKERMRVGQTPREILSAIVEASFGAEQFSDATVATWLAFYAETRKSSEAYTLLNVYTRRLRSNLLFALRQLSQRPEDAAEMIGALIDGLYIRQSLRPGPASPKDAIRLVETFIDNLLIAERAR